MAMYPSSRPADAWYPECLYTATSGDQVLMQHSGRLEHMAKLKIKALADGGFVLPGVSGITGHTEDNDVLIPFDVLELYEDPSKTEERLLFNAQLCHLRARSEHLFARNRLGRFDAFHLCWYMKLDFLYDCLKICMKALNMELFMQHGLGGYAVSVPPIPYESLQFQRERYPPPEPKEGAKKRKKEEENEVGVDGQQPIQKYMTEPRELPTPAPPVPDPDDLPLYLQFLKKILSRSVVDLGPEFDFT